MLARCTVCQSTFVSSQFGQQTCPKCGAEVFIEDPRVAIAHPAAPAPEVAPPPQQPIPWERRKELGLVRAFTSTLAEVAARPTPFFEGASYKSDTGASLYLVIVYIVPSMVAAVVSAIMTSGDADTKKALETLHTLSPNIPPDLKPLIDMAVNEAQQQVTFGSLISAAANSALLYVALFAITAAAAHGVLMLLGAAKGGWMATYKVFVYSATPWLYLLIPNFGWIWYVGAVGALLWSAYLEIIGLAKAHKTTPTYATVSIVAPELLCFTCLAAGGFLFVLPKLGSFAQ